MADDLELDYELEEEDQFDSETAISIKPQKLKQKISLEDLEEDHNPGTIEVTDIAEIQNEELELNRGLNEEHVDVGEQLANQFGFEHNSQIAASYRKIRSTICLF